MLTNPVSRQGYPPGKPGGFRIVMSWKANPQERPVEPLPREGKRRAVEPGRRGRVRRFDNRPKKDYGLFDPPVSSGQSTIAVRSRQWSLRDLTTVRPGSFSPRRGKGLAMHLIPL